MTITRPRARVSRPRPSSSDRPAVRDAQIAVRQPRARRPKSYRPAPPRTSTVCARARQSYVCLAYRAIAFRTGWPPCWLMGFHADDTHCFTRARTHNTFWQRLLYDVAHVYWYARACTPTRPQKRVLSACVLFSIYFKGCGGGGLNSCACFVSCSNRNKNDCTIRECVLKLVSVPVFGGPVLKKVTT